jgi:integrase
MSRSPRVPSYRYHKNSRQAVVVIRGQSFYLGPWNSPESKAEYRRVIAEHWSPDPGPTRPAASPPSAPPLTVDELILAYWKRKVVPYYVKDGRPTSERDNIHQALRPLRRLYGPTPARDFGPLALKAVRRTMIEAGRCRRVINKDVHRVRALFKWATGEELYPGEALAGLAAVEALEKGRSEARDRPPIAPVAESVVLATIPRLAPRVAAMVRLQLLTAARPGEVCAIRPRDVDRSDPSAWTYRPGSHKTQHHGRERVIVLGPRAIEVLQPWLDRDPDAYCFSPAEAIAGREAARRPGKGGKAARRPRPGGRYTDGSYRVAVWRACDRAFPHPTIRKERGRPLADEQVAELKAWRKAHRWHPHQLRHTKATEIRRAFDTEAAQVILGHSKPDTTIIYAERDLAKARELMPDAANYDVRGVWSGVSPGANTPDPSTGAGLQEAGQARGCSTMGLERRGGGSYY